MFWYDKMFYTVPSKVHVKTGGNKNEKKNWFGSDSFAVLLLPVVQERMIQMWQKLRRQKTHRQRINGIQH